ncbi:MAG: adenylosuccinate lyase [Capsulimonadaceae bacterium]|nr:adenylosuccinate lyase [Capsulimonadaceae bacterium]
MSLQAISPIDGRYARQTAPASAFFSESALIKHRVRVEIAWLLALSSNPHIPQVRPFTADETALAQSIADAFDSGAAERVKQIETTTNHDVKAVEYYIKERLAASSLADVKEWVHFACTSEDINNLAHALMLKGGIEVIFLPAARGVVASVAALAVELAEQPMLARTHGQPASPTTLGKELAVFVMRWNRQLKGIAAQEYLGKINGAVGNWNAHTAAYPDLPWPRIAQEFVESLGLTYNPLTTQIEPHDYLAECFHALMRFNSITIDFARDIWAYISLGYFKQRVIAGEVGSSTMPHKVNPIDFENAEANLGVANALLDHLAGKLPVSRLQRDLTDSSALRNIGVGIAHTLIALSSLARGLSKLTVNSDAMAKDLDENWVVLGEAIQTVMRKAGHENPYEKLKELTRGASIGPEEMRRFIDTLELPDADKQRMRTLTPGTYTGLASELAKLAANDGE